MKDVELPHPIPGYEPVEFLGYACGGKAACSSVLIARKAETRTLVVLTVSNQAGHGRFPVDVAAVGRLEHPSILGVLDVGDSEGYWYEAVEYIEARTLAETLSQGPLAVSAAVAVAQDLAFALEYARERGMYHRNLTPGSILLTENDVPKLHATDFALSVATMEDATSVGHPAFSPPEWFTHEPLQLTPATEGYMAGAVLYAMLTGQFPFVGPNREMVIAEILRSPPVPLRRLVPSVPCELEGACLKSLDKLPARRYRTARDLALAISCS